MSKDSRRQYDYRENASKLHIAVGELLRNSSIFQGYRVYQEYPVNRVSPYFDSGRERFDWVILDLMVIIEVHGQQHYGPVCFGGITEEEATLKFIEQKHRDELKKVAAIRAGWTYVVFRYDEEPTISLLLQRIQDNAPPQVSTFKEVTKQIKSKTDRKDNDRHKAALAKAKEYRKQRYRAMKERRNAR